MDTAKSPAEQRVVLRNVSWETYERLLGDHENSSAPRFAYDRGELEIMSTSPEHEKLNRRIALLVLAFTEEMGVESEGLSSTTFRREDLERGFEPDSCFYLQNEELVRDKNRIDLAIDPPPDLVIEVDITSPSINKLSIYARIGVPEAWRYDGAKLGILKLGEGEYVAVQESVIIPGLSGSVLTRLIERSKSLRRTVWVREVREAAKGLSG